MKRYFWEGQDSVGRSLRAYLITDEAAHQYTTGRVAMGPNRVAFDTELPAIEFRTPKQWTHRDAERGTNSEEWATALVVHGDLNRIRQRYGRRLSPIPKPSGTAWVRVATVSMREVMHCRSLGMSMGVANGHKRPGLLSVVQLGTLLALVDQRMEAGATSTAATSHTRPRQRLP